jgi:type IV secretion system protein TrbL
MDRPPLVLAGFPNPVDWAVDKVTGFVGGVAEAGFELIIGGLTAWVLDAVVWVVGGVFSFFLDATDPNVQADWFITGNGPYATTAAIAATLLVGFVLAGIVQGVLAGDVGGMLRRMALDLPLAVLGMVGLVTIAQALIRLTDELSRALLANFTDDIAQFTAVVGSLSALSGGTATAFVIFLLGLVTVLAGIVLVTVLVVRSALIYIVVALAPLVFAAQLWPALRGIGRKVLELLVALIVSKLVIAVALAVAAAAMVGSGSGGEVTSLPPPEVVADNPGGSVAQAVGILLAAMAAFGVAAFSPLLVTKLMPITEAAVVAAGIGSAPMRAGQQALSVSSYARIARGSSSVQPSAAGQASNGATAGGGAGGAASAGGAAAGGAAAGATLAAKAATTAASTGARASTAVASDAADRPATNGATANGRRPRTPPHAREGGDER